MERPSTPSRFNQVVVLIASFQRQLGLHPCTTLLLGLCFFLPALLLGMSSLQRPFLNRRGTAELFEISRRARLVQSFKADPSEPVPRIWQQRLGPTAAPDRWARHARGLWWLIWLEDGEPLLALPAVSRSSSLDLLFADELHRCSFNQLPPLKRREPSALEQSCLQRLTSGTSVQWQPTGLASISGSRSPALASVSHGCLRVALQGDRLLAEGPVAPSPFASLQTHHRNTQPISFASIRRLPIWSSKAFPCSRCWDFCSTIHCLQNNSTADTDCQRRCATFFSMHLSLYGSMRSRLAVSRFQFRPG